jgi:iron complex transport system permease protein
MKTIKNLNPVFIITVLSCLLFAAAAVSLFLGRYAVSPEDVFRALASFIKSGKNTNNAETVLFKVRLPRILAAALAGGSLSAAGLAFQIVFKNPLASPDLLGASAGAGFGACIAVIAGFSLPLAQLAGFAAGLLAVGLTCLISGKLARGHDGTTAYVLVGMAVNAVFHGGIGIAKYIADPYSQLQTITFWLMGSMTLIDFTHIPLLALGALAGLVPLVLCRWKLNLLSFSDEESAAMGLDTSRFRLLVIVSSTLLCSSAVAACGMVGWVGLMIPHICRFLLGADTRFLLPAAFVAGGAFLILMDDITRLLTAIELPLGVLTALFGAPVFIALLVKGGAGGITET